MKPTQQEIIELAREQGLYLDGINTQLPLYVLKQEELVSLVHLALERFGAGGGEPVATVVDSLRGYNVIGYSCDHINALPPGTNLYTHSSPTELRAEYLRGLEDAARVCKSWANQHSADSGGCTYADCDFVSAALDCAEAIEALKG